MTITQIDTNVHELVKNFNQATFVYDFMTAFGFPKATIARLKKGTMNMSKEVGETLIKKKFWLKELTAGELETKMKTIKKQEKIKHDPRFVILTDYTTILAYDTKTKESLDTTLKELTKEYAFFLPLAGMEKTRYLDENPADVKAAEKMAKLFDEIKKQNPTNTTEAVHQLNVFLSRLLFCFFSEDTQIFTDNQFTNAIAAHTQEDGSDLSDYLTDLFDVLNQAKRPKGLAKHFAAFPYVNGGLFQEKYPVPSFSKRARKLMIECGGDLDWSAINPDIFGSMIQAVVTPEHRGGLGMHYTSVPNIMKVIEPLFLDDLYGAFKKSFNSATKLKRLHLRLTKLKIFDPACGSGNFLIIAYKEIRKLEVSIFRQLAALGERQTIFFSSISLAQFYGIELDDFAHEVASLSLWLAEHQMNTLFLKEFGQTAATLPLKEGGKIVHGNACRLDWEKVCPKKEGDEIYILGNPPYLGGKLQSKEQKEDTKLVFQGFKKYNNIDYIGCWFLKAAEFLEDFIIAAFVSTNSISQGTQVFDFWRPILTETNVEIGFAVKDFVWNNNAKNKAKVICSIIGIREKSNKSKFIYKDEHKIQVKNINGYLLDAPDVYVGRRTKSLSEFPKMIQGNIALDNGHLQLTPEERRDMIKVYKKSDSLIRRIYGSKELINSIERYCLWITDESLELAESIKPISDKISKVKEIRLKGATNAKSCADRPHQFCMVNTANDTQIVLPRVSSIKREYIPMKFLDKSSIVSDAAQVILDAELYIFGILNSKIHMSWVRNLAGKLKNDFRYSAGICWNSFPFPKITDTQKEELETHVYAVLEQRELHSEKTLAQLYDPDKMPDGLRAAHHELDLAVERCYRKEPFTSDEERLAYLFKLYEKMIAEEANALEKEKAGKKSRKKKAK